jgi:hypothetical protein
LIKETKTILDAKKKELEEKQHKTQQEMETLEQLNIIYKLTGIEENAWENVLMLFTDDKQHDIKPANSSVANKDQEILELKKQN